MNTPEHLPPVATRRGLNGYFVDFRLLPVLLHRTHRLRDKDAIQRNWAAFLKHTDHDEHYQALAVQSPLVARTNVHAWRLAKPSRIAGVLPSSPTNTKLFILRKMVRYFSSMQPLRRKLGEDAKESALCGGQRSARRT